MQRNILQYEKRGPFGLQSRWVPATSPSTLIDNLGWIVKKQNIYSLELVETTKIKTPWLLNVINPEIKLDFFPKQSIPFEISLATDKRIFWYPLDLNVPIVEQLSWFTRRKCILNELEFITYNFKWFPLDSTNLNKDQVPWLKVSRISYTNPTETDVRTPWRLLDLTVPAPPTGNELVFYTLKRYIYTEESAINRNLNIPAWLPNGTNLNKDQLSWFNHPRIGYSDSLDTDIRKKWAPLDTSGLGKDQLGWILRSNKTFELDQTPDKRTKWSPLINTDLGKDQLSWRLVRVPQLGNEFNVGSQLKWFPALVTPIVVTETYGWLKKSSKLTEEVEFVNNIHSNIITFVQPIDFLNWLSKHVNEVEFNELIKNKQISASLLDLSTPFNINNYFRRYLNDPT